MKRTLCVAAAAAAAVVTVAAQNAPLTFDVASVKPSPDPRSVEGMVTFSSGAPQPGGTWRASFATLEGMVRTLYPGHAFPGQIVGGPAWMATERFEVTARTDPARTPDEMRQMARALLADRFKLAVHTETREVPAYLLVLARRDGRLGPGLRPPAIDCDAFRAARARGEPIPPEQQGKAADRMKCAAAVMPVFPQHQIVPNTEWRLTAGGRTIASLVALMANQVGRPVVDRTGLTQLFDVEVQFSPTGRPAVGDASLDVGPRFATALEEQAGLKLEEGRAPVEVIVIDRVERPSPD